MRKNLVVKLYTLTSIQIMSIFTFYTVKELYYADTSKNSTFSRSIYKISYL